MDIKIIYRKNLKMSPQKLAAVCTHIGKEIGNKCHNTVPMEDKVVVLMASDRKFEEYKSMLEHGDYVSHIHIDTGLKEVAYGTECALGFVEGSSSI